MTWLRMRVSCMFHPSQDTVEDSQDTVEATEAETPDAANLAQGNAETARRVEAEEQPAETGQPEVAEPEDQPEDQTEAEPSEALEASKDTKVAWELEDEAGPAGGMGRQGVKQGGKARAV